MWPLRHAFLLDFPSSFLDHVFVTNHDHSPLDDFALKNPRKDLAAAVEDALHCSEQI